MQQSLSHRRLFPDHMLLSAWSSATLAIPLFSVTRLFSVPLLSAMPLLHAFFPPSPAFLFDSMPLRLLHYTAHDATVSHHPSLSGECGRGYEATHSSNALLFTIHWAW